MKPTAALLSILALVGAAHAGEPTAELPEMPEILASDFEVVDLSGETVPLADLVEEGRPVVIEFWATWCVPCRKSLPHLVDLKEKYGARLVILGLTVEDPREDLDKVRRFAGDNEVNFPIAFATDDLFRFMTLRPDVAVPKLFVFDGKGHLVEYIPRYSPLTPRKIRTAVRRVVHHG